MAKKAITWKDNKFLLYLATLLFISIVNLVVRLGSAIGFSNYLGLSDGQVEYAYGFLPVLSYTESNVVLYKQMSTYSLIAPALVIFLGFLYVLFKKKKNQKSEHREVVVNSWYIGLYIGLIQFLVAILIDSRIQFAHDWWGILPVIIFIIIGTFLFYKKK